MTRWALLAALAACVPVDAIETDAGIVFADNPAPVCGSPYTPCCERDRCANGWRCRAGTCIAPQPRCVAQGVADPALTQGVDIEPIDVPRCGNVPTFLREDDRAGAYREGDGLIARLDCEGLDPGTWALRTRLRIRLTIPEADNATRCECGGGPWNIAITQTVAGFAPRALPGLDGIVTDGSCRFGPEINDVVRVSVGADGRLRVRLDIGRCDRNFRPTVCHFLQGTSMTAEAP